MPSLQNDSRLLLSLLILLTLATTGCVKKKKTDSLNSWLTEFSTVSTSITDGNFWDFSVYPATDPSGNLYLSGSTQHGWAILKSTNGGSSWTEVRTVSNAYGYQIASDSLGNVYAVGAVGTVASGQIAKYNVGTGTWSTIYTGQIQSGKATYLLGIGIDSSNNIYVTGTAKVTLVSPDGYPDMDVSFLFTMKSTNQGSTWNLVDMFALDDYSVTSGIGVNIAQTGEVYVFGNAQYFNRAQNVIRKSTDNGATWTRIYEDFGTNMRGMAAWGSNLILTEDYYSDGGGYDSEASRVRGTSDSFGHLTKLDEFIPENFSSSSSSLLTGPIRVDPNGRAYYPLRYIETDGTGHLLLRGTLGDGEWVTLDDYTVPDGETLYMNDVLIAGDAIYNVGILYNTSGTTWILRKATVADTDTVTPEALDDGTDLVSPIPTGAKRIYLTGQTHDGSWGGSAGSAIASADLACNTDWNKPLVDSSVTYKAFLVNSTRRACSTANCGGGASENLNWVLAPNTTYVTREGISLGTTNSAGIFTSLARALLSNTVDRAYTGLEADSVDWTVSAYTCNDWTSNSADDFSTLWTPRGTNLGDIYSYYNYTTCDMAQRLICVEQ